MVTYNECKDLVDVVVKLGHSILEVEINGVSNFFLVKEFTPPQIGSIQSSSFMQVVGKNITRIFESHTIHSNEQQLNNTIRAEDEKYGDNRFEFSTQHVWRHYTSKY